VGDDQVHGDVTPQPLGVVNGGEHVGAGAHLPESVAIALIPIGLAVIVRVRAYEDPMEAMTCAEVIGDGGRFEGALCSQHVVVYAGLGHRLSGIHTLAGVHEDNFASNITTVSML